MPASDAERRLREKVEQVEAVSTPGLTRYVRLNYLDGRAVLDDLEALRREN